MYKILEKVNLCERVEGKKNAHKVCEEHNGGCYYEESQESLAIISKRGCIPHAHKLIKKISFTTIELITLPGYDIFYFTICPLCHYRDCWYMPDTRLVVQVCNDCYDERGAIISKFIGTMLLIRGLPLLPEITRLIIGLM